MVALWYNIDNERNIMEVLKMKKAKRDKTMINKIRDTLFAITVILMLWVAASTIEVRAKHLNGAPQYNSWNFYEVVCNLTEKA